MRFIQFRLYKKQWLFTVRGHYPPCQRKVSSINMEDLNINFISIETERYVALAGPVASLMEKRLEDSRSF